jgi:adhesin/invasin
VVQIFCTGFGPVTNQPATGAPAPGVPFAQTTAQPTVMIGGAPATVQFSGLTPGYAGLYQVNALVPQGSTKGSAVPVVISIGGTQSNTVTIAVK